MNKETVYVVTDRDMETFAFDTMLFTTYEKAMLYIQDALKDFNKIYDHVIQDDEDSWLIQDEGEQPRIVELSSKVVW